MASCNIGRRVRVGNVYAIPVDERDRAIAQIVALYRGGWFYLAVYEALFDERELGDKDVGVATATISPARLMLLGLTVDARIWSGDWMHLGTISPPDDLPFPAYRVGPDEDCYVEDYTATKTGECGDRGLFLSFRTVVAPAVVEQAVRAKHGRVPWDSYYDTLRVPEDWARSSAFFP